MAGRVLGRQCLGLAEGHDKQPGPGLRCRQGGHCSTRPGAARPCRVQGDPKRHRGARCPKISSVLAEGVPPCLSMMRCGTGSALAGAYALVVGYF